MKYRILLRIIDELRREATDKYAKKYHVDGGDIDALNAARSRAFVHLYIKVMFGISDFETRERQITDGPYDGGIDGYYIDKDRRTIYIIQSKFRSVAKNFESKSIQIGEIIAIDVDRIARGEEYDEKGNKYNGKIMQLQRDIGEIYDVARYEYKIIIVANVNGITNEQLKRITGGYPTEVFDFAKCYDSLVFPIITGTYFKASDLVIPIDLSNKNSGSKISYQVATKISDCEITVLFVPTIEIAKIMNKYKNSILKYNPRSYLDLDGHSVNSAIERTIRSTETNEFALFNNGITMLSDETYINERIGQKNKAQLVVKNPQIINGGQTSYTLSRIYESTPIDEVEKIFSGKEVLVKIITLLDDKNHEDKLQLIGEISNATNKQTPVINADRFSNDVFHQRVQDKLFKRYGLLYEKKRGEFSEGIFSKYISEDLLVERNLFLRVFYSSNGNFLKGAEKKLFQRNKVDGIDLNNDDSFDRFYIAYNVFKKIVSSRNLNKKVAISVYGKIFAYCQMFSGGDLCVEGDVFSERIGLMEEMWAKFCREYKEEFPGSTVFGRKFQSQAMLYFHNLRE